MPTKAPEKSVSAQSFDSRWQVTFDEDTRFFSWRATRGYAHLALFPAIPVSEPGRGTQVYTPFGLRFLGKPTDDWRVNFTTRSGYVWSRQESSSSSGEVSTATDTSVNAKIYYLGFNGWQPYVAMNVNIPTGISALMGNKRFARMDPDLVDVPTFGEGWNLAPTVGLNIAPTRETLVSVGFGYNNRGVYRREGSIDPVTLAQAVRRLDPGDTLTLTGSAGYDNDIVAISVSGSYTWETATTLDLRPFYQSGDRYRIAVDSYYALSKEWTANLYGSYLHHQRNKVADVALPVLVVEAFNSNSDVYLATLDVTCTSGKFAIGPTGGYLYRSSNAWSPTAFEFLPAKTRWSAGGAGSYRISDNLKVNARAEHIWISEGANAEKFAFDLISQTNIFLPGTGIPAVSATGWLVSLGATATW